MGLRQVRIINFVQNAGEIFRGAIQEELSEWSVAYEPSLVKLFVNFVICFIM